MLLWENLERSRLPLVQLTGTMTENARTVMGTKIFSLQWEKNKVSVKGQKNKGRVKTAFFFLFFFNFKQKTLLACLVDHFQDHFQTVSEN